MEKEGTSLSSWFPYPSEDMGVPTMDSALLAHWACAFPYPCED